jgi:hypothetical protein
MLAVVHHGHLAALIRDLRKCRICVENRLSPAAVITDTFDT